MKTQATHRIKFNFFWKLFLSFILTFLLPLTAIVITYIYASRSVRRELIDSNYNTSKQFFSTIDKQFSEMTNLSYSILHNAAVMSYSNYSAEDLKRTRMPTYYICEYLKNISRESFENLFLYYPKLSLIISGDTSLDLHLFYQTYYKGKTDFDTFADSFDLVTPRLIPHLISLNADPVNPLLGITISNSVSSRPDTLPDIISVIALKSETLRSLFESSSFRDNIIMIWNKDGDLLAASDKAGLSFDIDGSHRNEKLYYRTIGGQRYAIQTFQSSATDNVYISAIPIKFFWRQLEELQGISALLILLSLVLSLIAAWQLAKKNYAPIDGVIHRIAQRTDSIYTRQNSELEFIDTVMEETFEKVNALLKTLDTHDDMIRDHFLMQAMRGSLPAEDEKGCREIFLQNHLPLLSCDFGAILFTVCQAQDIYYAAYSSNSPQILLEFILSNITCELAAQSHSSSYLVPCDSRQYCCIINYSENSEPGRRQENLAGIAEQTVGFLKQHFQIMCYAALSEAHSGADGICSCYRETKYAAQYHFFYNERPVIRHFDIRDYEFAYDASAGERLYTLFLSYIKGVQFSENNFFPAESLNAFLGVDRRVSIESLLCMHADAVNAISKLVFQLGASNLEEFKAALLRIQRAQNIHDFNLQITDLLFNLKNRYRNSNATHTVCDRVERYIELNYKDANLNNNMLSDLFSLSSSYLIKMYKEQKGISPIEYLLGIRIEKIKFFLVESALGMEGIAAETGFWSSSSLIKAFKKSEGITPGTYRKLYGKPSCFPDSSPQDRYSPPYQLCHFDPLQ